MILDPSNKIAPKNKTTNSDNKKKDHPLQEKSEVIVRKSEAKKKVLI